MKQIITIVPNCHTLFLTPPLVANLFKEILCAALHLVGKVVGFK